MKDNEYISIYLGLVCHKHTLTRTLYIPRNAEQHKTLKLSLTNLFVAAFIVASDIKKNK